MTPTRLPVVGDVLTSQKFAFGYYADETKRIILVDGKTIERLTTIFPSIECQQAAKQKGRRAPRNRSVDLGAHDESRGRAEFVVESACMQGGARGNRHTSERPDGWHVSARRLRDDGTYDPDGEVIDFYMSVFFTNAVPLTDVTVTRKMRMMFV